MNKLCLCKTNNFQNKRLKRFYIKCDKLYLFKIKIDCNRYFNCYNECYLKIIFNNNINSRIKENKKDNMREFKINKKKDVLKKIRVWNVNKLRFKVKPYLSNLDYAVLNRICLEEFYKEKDFDKDENLKLDRYDYFSNIRLVFNTYILQNICEFKNFELDNDTIQEISQSKIMYKIIKNIKNYNEIWNLVIKSIELKNVYISLNLLRDVLPNTNALEENTKQVVSMINEINKTNPDLLNKIVQGNLIDSKIAQSMQKAKEEKNNKNNNIQ